MWESNEKEDDDDVDVDFDSDDDDKCSEQNTFQLFTSIMCSFINIQDLLCLVDTVFSSQNKTFISESMNQLETQPGIMYILLLSVI